MPDVDPKLLDPLMEWLSMPSISNGPGNPEGIRAAAEWTRDRVNDAGGTCELVETKGNPLVVGHLEANTKDAPTVLIYGHYDVQDVSDLSLWTTPPFEPEIRGDRIYARGASDDKGNLWPLLYTACEMFKAGELPVNVRVLVEGEEERGSSNLLPWLAADTEHADAAIVFDSGGPTKDPAITLGARGLIGGRVKIRVADRDVHSGIYGGAVPNAIHELARLLEAIMPGSDGSLRAELRAGIIEPPAAEVESWNALPPGDVVVRSAGARPIANEAVENYYRRNGFEPSLDVNEFKAGDERTIVPANASVHMTMRLAPGQDHAKMRAEIERLLREAAPSYVDLDVALTEGMDAGSFDPECPAIQAARRAYTKAFGEEPILWRLGGTLPLLDVLAKRGIDTILAGFGHGDDRIHAPDESYRLEALEMGAKASRALFEELAGL